MSATGIEVSDEALSTYNDWKLKKIYGFVTFKIDKVDGEDQVVVDQTGDKEAGYDEFVEALTSTERECRYGSIVINYENDGSARDKGAFFVWCPEDAKVFSRMIYAGTKATVKNCLEGIQIEIQANEFDDLEFEAVVAKCQQQFK